MSTLPSTSAPRMTTPASITSGATHSEDWPALPTETEIYILPDGRVVIADLPAELADCLPSLGTVAPGAVVAVAEQSQTAGEPIPHPLSSP